MRKPIILTIVCLLLCGGLFAQSQKLSLHEGKATLGQVFRQIESQTGMSVDYNAQEVNLSQKVNVPAGAETVKALLDAMLDGVGYTYTINKQHIIIKAQQVSKSKDAKVTGTVVDGKGLPVLGVGVVVKGTSNGTVTDIDGHYSIEADGNAVLVFTSLGYKTVEVAVGKRSVLDVTLEEDTLFLEDAVVVGYGVQKKENLTGAVSVVNSESISKRSNSSLGGILQGTVPGLTVTKSSGRPDEGSSLNIRGWNSINSGSPLVLIDGVVGSLERVNPNDVESITVLKDASSAAVYGAKAGFGVILVTTKSGGDKNGHGVVHYSGRWGFATPTTSTDWETRGYDQVYTINKFSTAFNGKKQILYDEADMAELWVRRDDVTENPERPWVVLDDSKQGYKYYANTDWWHVFFNDVNPSQNHDISFRGGSKTFKYFLSGNFNKEQGLFHINPDVYKTYNLRARVSYDVKPWLNVSYNGAFYSSNYTYPGIADTNSAMYKCSASYFSYLLPQNPEGYYLHSENYGGGGQTILGNLANEHFKNRRRTNNFTQTIELTLKPIQKLEIKGNYTYSFNDYYQMNRSVNGVFAGLQRLTTENQVSGDNEDKLVERTHYTDLHSANLYATYTDTFADAHHFTVMAGGQFEASGEKNLTLTGYDLLSEELNDQNLLSADDLGNTRATTAGGQSEYALLGFFGRVNYDYKGKYLVELSGRYDGTSRFKRGQRFGLFPSGSFGWRFSEEEFFSPLKGWWNDAKIRFSYGSLGNQLVGYYDYIRTVSMGKQNYLFGGDKSSVATFSAPVARNLTWETVQQKNIGLDLAFLQNKIMFTGEAYIRDTKNMLTTGKALPAVYGASAPKTNNADLRTLGYELSLTYRDSFSLLGKPFNYTVTGTFNDFVGYITKFDNPTKNLSTFYEGMHYGEIWGYITDGYFLTDEEAASTPVDQSQVCSIIYSSEGGEKGLRAGDVKYVDLNGDNIIGPGANTVDNPGDRKIIGNSQPRFQYGFTLGFDWNGIDFSAFFQGVGRLNWYPSTDSRYFWGPYARQFSSWVQRDFLDRCWSEENPNAYFPRPRAYVAGVGDGRELTTVNDKYLQNLGYLRLKNLSVGYTLPAKWMKKVFIDTMRIYFSGENLAYLAPGLHCDYIDPEAAAKTGKKDHIYPWQKTYMFGIDITF